MSVHSRALLLLRQAEELREQVRRNLLLKRFVEDDVQSKVYNDLAELAATLFPKDPVLNGDMSKMPDANIQAYTAPWAGTLPSDLPTRRLDTHLTRLVYRLSFILGDEASAKHSPPAAAEMERERQVPEVRQVLDALEELRRQQPELPPIDVLAFDFVESPLLRQLLSLDYIEAQRAFGVGAFKAASLLAGGIVEGMLLDALCRPTAEAHPGYLDAISRFPKADAAVNWNKVSLNQLASASLSLGLIDETVERLIQGTRDYRDTVHPQAELRAGSRAGREEAELLVAGVRLLCKRLSLAAPPNKV